MNPSEKRYNSELVYFSMASTWTLHFVQVMVSAQVGENLLKVAEQCGAIAVNAVSKFNTQKFVSLFSAVMLLLVKDQQVVIASCCSCGYLSPCFTTLSRSADKCSYFNPIGMDISVCEILSYFWRGNEKFERKLCFFPTFRNITLIEFFLTIWAQDFCFEGACCHCEMEVLGGATEVRFYKLLQVWLHVE